MRPPIPRRFWKFRIYHSGRDVKVWNDASKKSVSPKICGWTGDAKEGFEVHHSRPLTRQPLPAVDDDIHETISKVRSRLGGSEEVRKRELRLRPPYIEPSSWDIVTFFEIVWRKSLSIVSGEEVWNDASFPEPFTQRHNLFCGLISRTDPHPDLAASSQICFQLHGTKCTNLSS